MENRLENLEMKIAFQDETINELNDVITRLQQDVAKLNETVKLHEKRWEQAMPVLQQLRDY